MKKNKYIVLGLITVICFIGFLTLTIIGANMYGMDKIVFMSYSLITLTPQDLINGFFWLFMVGFILIIVFFVNDKVRCLENKKENHEKDNKD